MPFWYWYRGNPADDIDTLEDTGVISPIVFGLIVPLLFVWYGVVCILTQEAVWIGSFTRAIDFMGVNAILTGIASLAIALLLSARFGWHRVPILRHLWEIGFVAGIVVWLAAVIAIIVRNMW